MWVVVLKLCESKNYNIMMKLHDKDTKISEPTHFTMSISPLLQSAIQQQIGVQSEHVVDHHREMIKGVRVIMTTHVVLVMCTVGK